MVPPKVNRRGQHRRNCLLAFLEKCLNDPSKGNLIKWLDEPKGLFQILWVHGGRSNYQRSTHGCLFDLYRKYRGRSLISDPKQTFRMALKKSPCIQAAAGGSSNEDWRQFRIVHKCHDGVMLINEGTENVFMSLDHHTEITEVSELEKWTQKRKCCFNNSEKNKERKLSHVQNSNNYSYSIRYEKKKLQHNAKCYLTFANDNLHNESLAQYRFSPSRSLSLSIYDNCDYRCWNKNQSLESSEHQIESESLENLGNPPNSQLNTNTMNTTSASSSFQSTYMEGFYSLNDAYKNIDLFNNSQYGGFVDANSNDSFDIGCMECAQEDFNENLPLDNSEVWKAIEKLAAMYSQNDFNNNYSCAWQQKRTPK